MMAFPTATWREVGTVVAQQLGQIPRGRGQVLVALLLMVLGAVTNLLVPIFFGQIVDAVHAADPAQLPGIAGGLGLVALLAATLSAGGFYLFSRVTERIIANLRGEMVGTALGLPVHRVEEAGSGDLLSRSTDDVAELSAAVTETTPVLTTSIFSIATTAAALITLQWQFLLVVVAAAPLYYVGARNYLRVAPERYVQERAAMASRAQRVLEAIRGRATVRAFGMEPRIRTGIEQASLEVLDRGVSARRTLMTLQVFITLVELVMLSVGLLVGFWAVHHGTLSVGAVTAAMLMLIRLRGPLIGLMWVLDTVQSGFASLARIAGVIVDPPQPVAPVGAPPHRGQVEMHQVGFAYPGTASAWAVTDFTLSIAPGQTVALVGASGAGKTTVAALLAGLRVPDRGTVRVDGVEVSQLADSERAARIALVSQEVYVFSGTLRDDLCLAKPGASDAELRAALAAVGAEWFTHLADGLDTLVGARGVELDPVAAQQLALARILLLDPKVVVMDEATAEAGSQGAAALDTAARVVAAGRTALVVAHRLDQAAGADQILVMEAGTVIERGTHQELLKCGGRYSALWAAWQKGRE